MKFAHVRVDPTADFELAVIDGEKFLFVGELEPITPLPTLQHLLDLGDGALDDVHRRVKDHADSAWRSLTDVEYGPAMIRPPSTLAVGLNYDEHASELSLNNDSGPVLFSLFPNSLTGHNQPVSITAAISDEVDYEGELGVIIGKPARDVSADEALDYVFGYTVINDITARDIQFREPQWSRCKSFDTFTPIGPVVVTRDEIPDPQSLRITTEVDGLRVQDSNTSFMIRTVADLIASLSEGLTLLPGTIISTGSPGGAGRSRKPPLYLKPGSQVTVAIESIGELSSHCVEG